VETDIPLVVWLLFDKVPATVSVPAPVKFPDTPDTVIVLPLKTVSPAPELTVPVPVNEKEQLVLKVKEAPETIFRVVVPRVTADAPVKVMLLLFTEPIVIVFRLSEAGTLVIVPAFKGSMMTTSLFTGNPPDQLAAVVQTPPPDAIHVLVAAWARLAMTMNKKIRLSLNTSVRNTCLVEIVLIFGVMCVIQVRNLRLSSFLTQKNISKD
jgi:hypothetical protein